MIHSGPRLFDTRQKAALKIAVGAGAAAFAAGCYLAPERTWANLLLTNFFFISVSLAAAVFISIQNLSSAGWSVAFRRVPEAMTAYLPAGAALTALLLFGARFIYPWAAPGAQAALAGKAAYFHEWAVVARAAIYWAAWLFWVNRLVAVSRSQDASDDIQLTRRAQAISIGFLLCFAPTFSLSSVDWIMSLEPKWNSTIYPWYVFTGAFEAGLAAVVVLLLALRWRGFFKQINEHHLHDLGKYLFAFSIFWAYLWFSQFLLIWYSNLPEETTFYAHRLAGSWGILFWINPIVNFAVPFAYLLPASRKKRAGILSGIGVLLLAGHWLDLYLLVMPPVLPAGPGLGLIEVLIFGGVAAVYLLLFDRSFAAARPVPIKDPYLEESLHFEGV